MKLDWHKPEAEPLEGHEFIVCYENGAIDRAIYCGNNQWILGHLPTGPGEVELVDVQAWAELPDLPDWIDVH